MKYLLFAPFVLFFCSFSAAEDLKSPESVPNVSVNLIKEDKNLEAGTGMIVFSFQYYQGWVKGDTVRMSYNGKETKLVPTDDGKAYLGVKSGKYKFQFYLNAEHFEIKTDSILIKEQWQTGMLVTFESSLYPVEAEKPVIYVYPDTTQQVSIQLDVNGDLGFTYPFYNKTTGWNFTADPDGTIHMNDKKYDYLFWDGATKVNAQSVERFDGYLVQRDSLPTFFEQKLTAMGLTQREQNDFITYWCPRMQEHEISYIHFMFTEEYDGIATMNISPKPDHLFRVFLLWSDGTGIDPNAIQEQKIETVQREGFTVIEWGGGKCDFFDFQ